MASAAKEFGKAIRRSLAAFNGGDFESAFAGVAPDVEWHTAEWVFEADVIHGRAALIEAFRRMRDAGEWQVAVQGVEQLADGLFLVHQRGTATGRTTGIVTHRHFFQLFEVGPQGTQRVREFAEREEAIAAAGL